MNLSDDFWIVTFSLTGVIIVLLFLLIMVFLQRNFYIRESERANQALLDMAEETTGLLDNVTSQLHDQAILFEEALGRRAEHPEGE